jgi:hypothetical protein
MQKFTTMLRHLMDMNTKTKSILSVEDSHASHLAVLEGARALVMNVRYSQKFSEFYGKRMPDGFWEKMCQDSLPLMMDDILAASSMNFPKLGIALDGICTGRKTSEQFIAEIECSSLATPTASQDHKPIRQLTPSEANGTHGKSLVGDIGDQLGGGTGKNGESVQQLGLHPEFVETMMGFPIGWTDCERLETL